MEAAVCKHVTMILQYSTSSVYCMSYDHFFELVQPHLPPPAVPPADPFRAGKEPHPLARLMVSPDNGRFPHKDVDTWVHIALDEAYRAAEGTLAHHLERIPLSGIGLEPHACTIDALTEHTVDAAIEQGLFTTAIITLDPFLDRRMPALRACLQRRLRARKRDWSEATVTKYVGLYSILSLHRLKALPAETTCIILDMAHLWGSMDHYLWVKHVHKEYVVKERDMSAFAVGYMHVPAISPGWSLNDYINHDAVQRMLDHGPWATNPTGAPRSRTEAQLVTMSTQMASSGRGLVVLSRGSSSTSMEAGRCRKKWLPLLGPQYTRVLGLNDLPLYVLNLVAGVIPILVLSEDVGKAMDLHHWMLLLAHAQDCRLVVVRPDAKEDAAVNMDAIDTTPIPMIQIKSWMQEKRIRPTSCTVAINKTLPW